MRNHRFTISLLLMAMIMTSFPIGASAMSLEDRITQAQTYQSEGKLEEALLALDLATAIAPDSIEPILLQINLLIQLEHFTEAQALIETATARWPDHHAPYLYASRCALLSGDLDVAWRAMLTARVAIGDDQALAGALDTQNTLWLTELADALTKARRYEQAMALYAIHTPAEGEEQAFYLLALAKTSNEGPVVDLHPGITPADFLAALAADQLRLVPAPLALTFQTVDAYKEYQRYAQAYALYSLDEFVPPEDDLNGLPATMGPLSGNELYELISFTSLSPDGDLALVRIDGLPAILNLEDQSFCLLTPAAGLDEKYVSQVTQTYNFLLGDVDVSWSPNGRYLAVSFFRQTLMNARYGMNILLIDADSGIMKTVDSVPFAVRVQDEDFSGAPFRAVFDPVDDELLYYEVYGIPNDSGTRMVGLRAYDVAGGDTILISQYDAHAATSDPGLYATKAGIWHAYSGMASDMDAGIAMQAYDGGIGSLIPIDSTLRQAYRQPYLRDLKGESGLAYYINRAPVGLDTVNTIPMTALVPFSLEGIDTTALSRMIYVADHASADERLGWLDLAAYVAADAQAQESLLPDTAWLPYNGCLSPDGQYLLFVARQQGKGAPRFYLLDMDTGACGQIDVRLPEEMNEATVCLYNTNINPDMLGMTWVSGNRLLLSFGSSYQMYSFELAAK